MLADMHQPHTGRGIKGKLKPPRLHGKTTGVLASRTPHRPNAIGLSLCKLCMVSGRSLLVSGADVVDGTPVLDIKPYLPFCEVAQDAWAPEWVQVMFSTCSHLLHAALVRELLLAACVLLVQCRAARLFTCKLKRCHLEGVAVSVATGMSVLICFVKHVLHPLAATDCCAKAHVSQQ